MTHPAFSTPRDKQRLSYGAFTNQIFASTSTDSPTSPTADAPPLPPRNAGKGKSVSKVSLSRVASSDFSTLVLPLARYVTEFQDVA